MPASSQTYRVALVLRAWLDVLERENVEPLEALLTADAQWFGLEPGLMCGSRSQVLSQMRRGSAAWATFTSISAAAVGDDVVVSVEGPHLREGFAEELHGSAHLRLSFRDGLVYLIRAARTREDALVAEVPA